ncbi:MAG: diaminopimelate decarboxylase, partial [Lentisphaeraceae bacterium]|nr:diaminopimelate decarboxylase [Lentisphaeraceae bacterium]
MLFIGIVSMLEKLNFLSEDQCRIAADRFETPLYIYSQDKIQQACREALAFPNAFGLTVRYALKANPLSTFLKIADKEGVHFDASSEFELARCLELGISPEKIQLTSQQFPNSYISLFEDERLRFNACSLKQLNSFGKLFPGREVSIRINPGLGSGSNRKTNVGGPSSSFGIWFEQMDEIRAIAKNHNLKITRLHTHIGSGSDPEVWKKVASMTLEWAVAFEDVNTVNLGGGFKVARMSSETGTDLQSVGSAIKTEFERVAQKTGRKFHLEIEPGTYIAANSGTLLASVDDITDTGKEGYKFLKINTGMDAITRPALYAAQHPLITIRRFACDSQDFSTDDYIVTGHCCESGDMFTLDADENLLPRTMGSADLGDLVAIEGTGAYCSSMNLRNYTSFPALNEVLLDETGNFHLIRRADSL